MFTGLVTDVGRVRSIEARGDLRLTLETQYDIVTVPIGASIACNGICLTVVDKGNDWFAVDASAETARVTNLDQWSTGTLVNFERSLKLGDEMGGHIVSGHVDTVGSVVSLSESGASIEVVFEVEARFGHLLAAKGSVAINGVSLTVNTVEDAEKTSRFSVNIIPHTKDVTAFRALSCGDAVNIEFDMLARYVSRIEERRSHD